jgi:MFS family permease
VIGAAAVGVAVALGASRVGEAVLVAVIVWLIALAAGRFLGTGSVKTEGSSGISWPTRAVLPIALMIMLIAFVEGGLSDWGGIYLRRGVGSAEEVAAFAYAALALGLTIGRLGGDRAKDRVGSVKLIQVGMLVTAIAIAIMLLVGDAAVALLGLVVAGIGVANTIPQLFGAAGRIPPYGPSLSTGFTFLTFAFIIGPPLVGATTDAFGVSVALGLFVVASLVAAATITRVPGAETNPNLGSG